ncbi:MAG: hypothetical protein AABP62_28730 [Planctomycetota bacterium]
MQPISENDSSIINRLNALESENRRLKRWCGGALLGFLVVVTCGAALVADNTLILRDRDGNSRFVAGVHPEDIRNTFVSMSDDRRNQFLRMGNDPFNGSYFFILDRADKKRIECGVDKNNNEYMRFYDREGQVVRSLP